MIIPQVARSGGLEAESLPSRPLLPPILGANELCAVAGSRIGGKLEILAEGGFPGCKLVRRENFMDIYGD
jgi:hypothetical protein